MPIQLVHDWHIFSAAGNLSQTAFLEHCAAKYTGYIARLVVVSVEGVCSYTWRIKQNKVK
jgi:hypothetical protein